MRTPVDMSFDKATIFSYRTCFGNLIAITVIRHTKMPDVSLGGNGHSNEHRYTTSIFTDLTHGTIKFRVVTEIIYTSYHVAGIQNTTVPCAICKA